MIIHVCYGCQIKVAVSPLKLGELGELGKRFKPLKSEMHLKKNIRLNFLRHGGRIIRLDDY
jgi:hypothetical protein